MEADETILLPCPLCGGDMSVALHGDEFGWRWWAVQRGTDDATACKCRLFVESDARFSLDNDDDAYSDAHALTLRDRLIEKWNTRADSGNVTCGQCKHSRTERHTGDEQLVCWVRGTHGEAVPGDGYCFKGEL